MGHWIRIALLGGFLALGTWACDDGDDDSSGSGDNGGSGSSGSCTMTVGGSECVPLLRQ